MKNNFDDKQLYPLLFQSEFSKIELFLEKYGINSVDRDGRSFFINCVAEQKNSFAEKLLKLGADINQQDENGWTALHFAVKNRDIEMIDLLFKNPVLNKSLQNNFGKNAFGIALQNHPKDNDFLIKLVRMGIDPFVKETSGHSSYSKMKLYEAGEITIGLDKINITPVLQEIDKMYKDGKTL